MIIGAKIIKKSQTLKLCEQCSGLTFGPVLRLYGMAFEGETPFHIYFHPSCIDATNTPKIEQAFTKYDDE